MENKPSRILTREEIQELTGYKRPFEQRRTLEQMGIRFFVRHDGRPAVASSALDGHGQDAPSAPNFDALKIR